MKKRVFGELELAILSLFKDTDSHLTVRDVLKALNSEDKYTTIMTVMNRLVAKGELSREREGLAYRYSFKSKRTYLGLFERWKTKFFEGKSAQLISYLLEDQEITQEELRQLEKMIEAKRNGL